MTQQIQRVTKDLVTKINNVFENDNPAPLSQMLEIFVALLRNKKSKAVDVQLFFLDHAKLVSKMSKHETTYCSLELVEQSAQQLQSLQPTFNQVQGPADVSYASCFLEWSNSFCSAAKIDLKLKKLETDIEDLKLNLERSNLKIQRFAKMQQDAQNLGFREYYTTAIEGLETRIQTLENIVQKDLDQATAYQKQYKNFENEYFKEFMAIVQEINNE